MNIQACKTCTRKAQWPWGLKQDFLWFVGEVKCPSLPYSCHELKTNNEPPAECLYKLEHQVLGDNLRLVDWRYAVVGLLSVVPLLLLAVFILVIVYPALGIKRLFFGR